MKPRSSWLLLALSIAVAAVCIRLGVWQLSRLSEKRARNTEIVARMALPPLELGATLPAGDTLRYRRVRTAGSFDFAREIAIGSRARQGNPGVHIATPLLLAGHDTQVLVLRGWAYSANASTVDFARWHESANVQLEGYLLPYDTTSLPSTVSESSRTVYRLDRSLIERKTGVPLAPYFVMMTAGGTPGDSVPARMPDPVLDEGPHMSYAVQWFLFATIFGVGGVFVVLRARATSPG